MRHPHWTSDHRDALLTRVGAITVGVAAASAVGAVALGAGLQAGTTYASAKKQKPAPAPTSEPQAPVAAEQQPSTAPSAQSDGASAVATAAPLTPDQIHLVVYNATTTRGVASAAARILRSEGFHVDSVATYPGGAQRSSAILFSTDTAGGVRAVTQATGIQRSATSDTGSTVVLVLGRDWVSATTGTAWAPPQAAPQQQAPSGNGGGSNNGPATSSGGS